MKFFYHCSFPFVDSRRVVVSYKRNHFSLSLPRKSVVRLTDHLDMTIAVDCNGKRQTKQNKI